MPSFTSTGEIAKELERVFARDDLWVADDPYTLRVYGKDLWPRNLILARENETLGDPVIQAVAWPATTAVLARLARLATERDWELYPYGAGSGVCGGLTPSGAGLRPRVVVDLKRMDRIESLDEVSQVAKVQSGIIGQVLEEDLNQRGYTLGHFPSSIYCSSFGGYLATRAAGQFSTYYGKIEDMILALEGVLASGETFATPAVPRLAVGPDWNHLFLGSEGTLAFLTAATVKVHRLPESRQFLSFDVTSTEAALEGAREWLQAGLRPAVIRVYDEDESRMLLGARGGARVVCVVEGEREFAGFTAERISRLACSKGDWQDTGPEPAEHWWSHRYDVSYRQQQVMSHRRMILDTFEVAAGWSGLPELHRGVKRVAKGFNGSGEMLVALAHFSHFYHCGGNIYFTVCGRAGEKEPTEGFYDRVWEALLAECGRQGAAISHHHGIGRLKARAMARQRGPLQEVLKRLKDGLDPKRILNPENLGL